MNCNVITTRRVHNWVNFTPKQQLSIVLSNRKLFKWDSSGIFSRSVSILSTNDVEDEICGYH